jgi:hypothetical protein
MRRATIATVFTLVWLGVGCGGETPVQPLGFNHAIHVQKHEIECTKCHVGALVAAQASLPPLSSCLDCHMKPQGDPPSEAEAEVRRIAAEGKPFRWVQVTRNDGHVYFSHRAHTSFAEMECAECHGPVEEWTEPPTAPNAALVDMEECMSCHRSRGASNECQVCHR